jgi:putative pyruvate formate lyase activating enzyme
MRRLTRKEFIDSLGGSFYLGIPLTLLSAGSCKAMQDSRQTRRTDPDVEPGYLKLQSTGELKKRADKLWNWMNECRLCPRECGANRLAGEEGFCGASAKLEISSYNPHFGEERPLVGKGGSGTIFFSNCSLRCVFCINWQISQGGQGYEKSVEDLADMMLILQKRGCSNINIVTPTHYSAHLLRALDIAALRGLRLPLVYNTCGWEREEVLALLDKVVDIYLPDFKYSSSEMASKYSSGADDYPEITQKALMVMHNQVGTAHPEADGLMYRGLMIRHLVMPNNVSGTRKVIEWIGQNLPPDTYLNLMSQYRPMYRAKDYPKIARRLTNTEYRDAVNWARKAGLTNLDIQGFRLW